MSQEKNHIKCPNCGFDISVDEVFSHQAEERIRKDYEQKLAGQKAIMSKEKEQLEKERQEFDEKKQKENEIFATKLNEALAKKQTVLEETLRKNISNDYENKLKLLSDSNTANEQKLKDAQKKELEFLQKEKELKDREEQLQFQFQKQILEKSAEIEAGARKKEADRFELEKKELLKQIEDQKRLTEEMKRRQEQGSMQLQGEVQELAIEEFLRYRFPIDTIEEIKKGARGGDCIQTVNTHYHPNCGSIYYESKRTKEFAPAWIEKFKEDMRQKNVLFGVLVTEAMPKDMERMGQREGVWICNFQEFKALSEVLRESVILLHSASLTQENKGDKMSMLYDFLTGNEFKMQVEAIVEGFTQMQNDLDSEKRAMEMIWKKREKQISKVISNTSQFYGSIKGIAGNAIGSIRSLELPGEED